jgi:hypothetical protein
MLLIVRFAVSSCLRGGKGCALQCRIQACPPVAELLQAGIPCSSGAGGVSLGISLTALPPLSYRFCLSWSTWSAKGCAHSTCHNNVLERTDLRDMAGEEFCSEVMPSVGWILKSGRAVAMLAWSLLTAARWHGQVARPFAWKVTRWREDPFAFGSYSYMPAVRVVVGTRAGGWVGELRRIWCKIDWKRLCQLLHGWEVLAVAASKSLRR